MNDSRLNKKERAWVLYDVANSAFVLILTALLPIYYGSVARAQGMTEAQITAVFGTMLSVSALLIAIASPVLGAIADNKGMRKKMFLIFLIIGVVACFIFGLSQSIVYIAVVMAISKLGFQGSCVFYDSMLVDVTTDERMDKVSSAGYAWGYIGSCAPFIVCLALYVLSSMEIGGKVILPIGSNTAIIIGMMITGAWWFLLSVPLLRNYEQLHGVDPTPHQVRDSFRKIGDTLKHIKDYKECFMFILAFFFFINGVTTIIGMSINYAQNVLGADAISSILMVVALLMTQFVAFPFAIIFGKLADKYSPRWLIMAAIIGYTAICIYGYFMNSIVDFFILAFFVGLFQGGIQALSRSYFAKLVPKDKSNELFGVFDISGKGAAIVGPAFMSLATIVTNSARWGIVALIVFFVIGGVILLLIPKNKADLPNLEYKKAQAEEKE